MRFKASLAWLALFASACVPKLDFDPATAKDARVIAGMRLDQPHETIVSLVLLPTEANRRLSRVSLTIGGYREQAAQNANWIIAPNVIEPGEYSIGMVSITQRGNQILNVCLSNAVKFTVNAGEIAYIGDYKLTLRDRQGNGFLFLEDFEVSMNEARARDAITRAPHIKGVPRRPEFRQASVDLKEDGGVLGTGWGSRPVDCEISKDPTPASR